MSQFNCKVKLKPFIGYYNNMNNEFHVLDNNQDFKISKKTFNHWKKILNYECSYCFFVGLVYVFKSYK